MQFSSVRILNSKARKQPEIPGPPVKGSPICQTSRIVTSEFGISSSASSVLLSSISLPPSLSLFPFLILLPPSLSFILSFSLSTCTEIKINLAKCLVSLLSVYQHLQTKRTPLSLGKRTTACGRMQCGLGAVGFFHCSSLAREIYN